MHRLHSRTAVFWAGVLGGVVLLVSGAAIAYLGYAKTSGPDGAVRGYFAALARSDAPGALAFGDVPNGPHTLLTATALREQQRIAPLRHFSVLKTQRHGGTASVSVRYTLGFPDADETVTATVPVKQRAGEWRLSQVALPTQISVLAGAQRATILGARIPAGTVLLFPGAVPVRFDTPYLELDPTQSSVTFGANPTTQVGVSASDEGHKQALAAVTAALRSCLTGSADLRCPLPTERYVPGSLRATIIGSLQHRVAVSVDEGPTGRLSITGKVEVRGNYRRLDFQNRAVAGRGTVTMAIQAHAYPVPPLKITWSLG